MPNLTAGRGIGFKVGTQNSVNTIISNRGGATPGSFYLAEDTHRLYIGNDDTTLSPVNEGVTTVATTGDLPSLTSSNQEAYAGQFYYVSGSNILCVASGTRWVQINPDTYLLRNNGNTITLSGVADQTTGVVTATVSHSVSDAGGIEQHTASGSFQIRGSDNVQVTVDSTNKIITLSSPDGEVYTLTAATQSATDPQSVKLTLTGTNSVTGNTTTHDVFLEKGNGGVYPTLQADGKTIKLNGGGLAGGSFTLTELNGVISLRITDGNSTSQTLSFTPKIKIGNSEQDVLFDYNSTTGELVADLNVYTISEINNLLQTSLQSMDAMYFYGGIGTGVTPVDLTALLALTDVKSGATFKFVSAIDTKPASMTIEGWDATGNNAGAQVGDLLIVTGVEGSNGFLDLSANTTKFTYVPSGDDNDIYYTPDFSVANSLKFTKSDLGTVSTATFAPGTNMSVTGSVANGTGVGKTQTITIAHASMGNATDTPAADDTSYANNESVDYTALIGLTLDNGHVTGYQTKKITLTHNKLARVATVASTNGNNGIKFSQSYTDAFGTLNAGTNNNNTFGLNSSTLTFGITAAGNATGQTATSGMANISIDMVWGSF